MRRSLVPVTLVALVACNAVLGLEPLETYVATTDASTDVAPGPDAAPDADAAVRPLPDGAVIWPGNGHGYLVVGSDASVTWTEARDRSVQLGGHLVTIASDEENNFVAQISIPAFQNVGPWLGAYQNRKDLEPDGGWVWVTGEPWVYTRWDPGQPNNGGGNEDYAFYEGAPGSTGWGDVTEGNPSLTAYVVEFEPPF